MDGIVRPDEDLLLDDGPDTAGIEHVSSPGTFALRRAIYLNKTVCFNTTRESSETWYQLMLIPDL